MAKSNESGHAKNVAQFNELVELCTSFGTSYNPSKAALTLESLKTMHTDAVAALDRVDKAKTAFENSTNHREKAFDALKPLTTRIVNALAATDASKLTVDDAAVSKRKLQGRRARPIPPPEKNKEEANEQQATNGEEPTFNSVSQQSFDNLLKNFAKLVTTVSSEPEYKPNEEDLRSESLVTLLESLREVNNEAVAALVALGTARDDRNKLLYAPQTGLYDIVTGVKKYVRSVYGASSTEAKRAGKIKVNNLG